MIRLNLFYFIKLYVKVPSLNKYYNTIIKMHKYSHNFHLTTLNATEDFRFLDSLNLAQTSESLGKIRTIKYVENFQKLLRMQIAISVKVLLSHKSQIGAFEFSLSFKTDLL